MQMRLARCGSLKNYSIEKVMHEWNVVQAVES